LNPKPPANLTERQFLQIWYSQNLKTVHLKTTDGRPIEVIRRGTWNFDTGPDFKSALLRIGNQLQPGDIEVHLRMSDWYAHRHDKDPHYNQVILHVVLWKDLEDPVIRQDGQQVPTLVLDHLLKQIDSQHLFKTHLSHKSKSQQTSSSCLEEVKGLPWKKLIELLQEKADLRFQQKVRRFEARYWESEKRSEKSSVLYPSFGWDQLIYEGFLEALGYSINKKPFLKLAQLLPLEDLRNITARSGEESKVLWLQAVLLGTAGLLPVFPSSPVVDGENLDLETKSYLDEIHSLWEMLKPCLAETQMQLEEWQFFRLRPINSPIGRLARFSFVLAKLSSTSWIHSYVAFLTDSSEHSPAQIVKKLEASLRVPISGYWTRHTGFGGGISSPIRFAIGRYTLREMVINVLLPILYLYAEKTSRPHLQERVYKLYRTYPAPAYNRVTRFMIENLFRENSPQVTGYAHIHQGLLQLHTELCQMKGCPTCPYRTF
jgi:hypothetical protein